MNSMERRVTALENSNGKQDHIFVHWQFQGEVLDMECGGVAVHRQDGEEEEDFKTRAYERFERKLEAGIHWVTLGGIYDYSTSCLKDEAKQGAEYLWVPCPPTEN